MIFATGAIPVAPEAKAKSDCKAVKLEKSVP
jgi:hypothetical protein